MDHIADLERAASVFASVLSGIEAGEFTLATPCTEWDVRAVVDHVVGGTGRFTAILDGEPEPDRSVDRLGDDALGSFHRHFAGFLASSSRAGMLVGSYRHTRFGMISGEQVVRMRANEYLAHAWDLAVATGQVVELPTELATRSIDLFEELKTTFGNDLRPAYEPEVAGGDASTIDHYVAYFGRSPDWRPAGATR